MNSDVTIFETGDVPVMAPVMNPRMITAANIRMTSILQVFALSTLLKIRNSMANASITTSWTTKKMQAFVISVSVMPYSSSTCLSSGVPSKAGRYTRQTAPLKIPMTEKMICMIEMTFRNVDFCGFSYIFYPLLFSDRPQIIRRAGCPWVENVPSPASNAFKARRLMKL